MASVPNADPRTTVGAWGTAGQGLSLRLTSTNLVTIGLVGAAFCGLFQYWFHVQNFQSWNQSEDWGHAYFVPLVSLYLLWLKRGELARVCPAVFWPGLSIVLLGIATYTLFLVGSINNHMLRGLALIMTLWGLVLTMGGPGLARVCFWPVAYLVFAITISEKIMRDVTFALQLAASQGAWLLLNTVGVTTDLRGNVLEVTTAKGEVFPLNVAEACAGMRMVIGFVALGAAVALVAAKHWWQRVALLLLAVPVALLMNVGRVAVLGVLTLKDPALAQGQAHMLVGTILLIPAFILYMGIVWALNRTVRDAEEERPGPPLPTLGELWQGGGVRWSALARVSLVVPLVLLTSAAVAVPTAVHYMGIHLRKQPIKAAGDRAVQAVPSETESWVRIGADTIESAEMVEELGTENYLTRTYVERQAREGQPARMLGLHLAYYTGKIDTIPHVPERCMVGGGMQITGQASVIPLKLERAAWAVDRSVQGELAGRIFTAPTARGSTRNEDGSVRTWSQNPGSRFRLPRNIDELALRTTEFTDPKSGRKMYAGYFFIANGAVTASAESVRLLAFDYRDYYAYYLKVQVSGQGYGSAEEVAAAAESLIGELLPEIMRTVPDWVEVQEGRYPEGNPRAKAAPRVAGSADMPAGKGAAGSGAAKDR
ncbi:MAG: exosortase/archaeosortase family protein [Phycisphaerales bacterium]